MFSFQFLAHAGQNMFGWGQQFLYNPTLHCRHQKYSALRWAAVRATFNVSLTVRGKVVRQCSQTTTSEETGQPKRKSCTSVLASSISRQWPATRPGSYTSSIHSMEELLVTWHVQSSLYFIHPLSGRVTSLLHGMFKAIYTSFIHSAE